MVAMTKSQLQAEMNRLLVNNLAGDIEADEVLQVLIDFTDSITFPAPPGSPVFRSFSIEGQAAVVDAGFSLSGSQTFLYSVSDPAGVTGNLTIAQDASNLATDVDPSDNSRILTVNTVVFTAGQEVAFTIDGTGITLRQFSIRAREADEYVYYGTQVSSDPSTFDFANEQRTPISTGNQQLTLASFSGSEFVIIAQPTTESDFTEILIGSLNQLDAFTKTLNAFLVNGKNYDAWTSDRAQLGSVLSGEPIVLVR